MPSSHIGGAVVTGAASGIGRAIAGGLAADGFPVVIADLDEALPTDATSSSSSDSSTTQGSGRFRFQGAGGFPGGGAPGSGRN